MHEVIINNIQNKIKIDKEIENLIKQIVLFALNRENTKIESEVSMILVDNDYIKDLNLKYRNKNTPTDVLSFAMRDTLAEDTLVKPVSMRELLGDIVISIEMAQHQARDFGHNLEREIGYLTVHGVLHLLGYDHKTNEDKTLMRSREESILKAFDLSRKGK